MTIAIRFENVSKKFSLEQSRPRSWQETLLNLFQRKTSEETQESNFWVLKDINFEVYAGETLSVIGANGAGKSTLLKLLTNIIRPTHGTIELNGRVSALLELGTGFHPDLTGRENVYLGGILAGLSRSEIKAQMPNIANFADIGRFMDVPVRHYSSGMFVRLGFALAIHVNPDILIVDEVLAVGDESFQKKCMEKIYETRNRGATVLLVSHGMSVIRSMSDRVIWLQAGQIEKIGEPDEVIRAYMGEQQTKMAEQQVFEAEKVDEKKVVEVKEVEFFNGESKQVSTLETGQPATIRIHYLAHKRIERPIFGLAIHRQDDVQVNGPNTDIANFAIDYVEGPGVIEYQVNFLPLLNGTYLVTIGVFDNTHTITYDFCDRKFPFTVRQKDIRELYGLIYIPARWRHINHH